MRCVFIFFPLEKRFSDKKEEAAEVVVEEETAKVATVVAAVLFSTVASAPAAAAVAASVVVAVVVASAAFAKRPLRLDGFLSLAQAFGTRLARGPRRQRTEQPKTAALQRNCAHDQ